MQVNLSISGKGILPGYVNISPVETPDGILGSVTSLDTYIEDAEATEILARDVLDFMSPHDIDDIIEHWVRKLRHGGSLTIGGVDLPSVSQAIARGEMSIDDGNRLLYGSQDVPWNYRKATTSLLLIVEKLSGAGLKIMSKRYIGNYYSVTGVRP